MSALDTLRIAWHGIKANILRSTLTVLGVMIGVSAVIILLAVGTGSSAQVASRINALGTNTITVLGTGRFGRGPATTGTQSQTANLTTQSVQAIESPSQAPDVASVSPVVTTIRDGDLRRGELLHLGDRNDPELPGRGRLHARGRQPDHAVGRHKPQARGADRPDGAQQPVLERREPARPDDPDSAPPASRSSASSPRRASSGITNEDSVVIAPYTAVQDELTGYAPFSELLVQAKSTAALNNAATEVEDILAAQADTTVADLPFSVINEGTLLTTAQSTSSTFTTLLGAVAAISLLVGGIGVMNIMLVTVTERTREIGIRKAVGAPKAAILAQFLLEAVLLSLIGGGGGVLVGVIGSRFEIDGVTPIIAGYSIPLAFGIAIAVGVFFGLYPANRAASLRPIDALRYE